MPDTTVYPLTPHGRLRGPDTRVYVLKPEFGLIGGMAIIWNRPCHGAMITPDGDVPSVWKCVKAKGYSYKSLKYTPLLWAHDPDQDIGEVFTKSFIELPQGIFAFATLRDHALLIKAAAGLLYYSPRINQYGPESSVVKGGLMTELTLTDNPGTVMNPRSIAENQAVYRKLDAIRTAIMNYAGDPSAESLDDLPDDVLMQAASQALVHAPEDEATGIHEGQPIDLPDDMLSPAEAVASLSPYEQLVGPQTGRSRADMRRAGIGG